ncbi:MAG: flagellar motor protein MotB [Magnetococcus sp. DMHC-6]
MMAGKCPPCKKGAPAWLLTFGDMMSLLLTFFILLISMSTMDKIKFKEAAGSLQNAFGLQRIQQINPLPTGEDLISTEFQQELIIVHLKEKLEVVLENTVDAGEAELINMEEGFLLRLNNQALFLPESAVLRPEAKSTLAQIANLVKTTANLIRVEGHTSIDPPPAIYPNNWVRSANEAATIVDFFVKEGSLDPARLQVRGMGQYMPVADNDTKEGREKNHRIEIMISKETQPSIQESFVGGVDTVVPEKMEKMNFSR